MSGDRVWRLPWTRLDIAALREVAGYAASLIEGVSVAVEAEADDCHTCFFSVPNQAPDWAADETEPEADPGVVEVSIYDLDRDGVVLSLEADASDNDWLCEDADQIAEIMVEAIGGKSIDL